MMLHCLPYYLRQGWHTKPALLFLVILSVMTSFFCMGLSFSYGKTTAGYEQNYPANACISVSGFAKKEDAASLVTFAQKEFNISSALLFSKQDSFLLVGWHGIDPGSYYFPYISGRFFTEEELAGTAEENVVYLNEDAMKNIHTDHTIQILGRSYTVIGCGFIDPYNFQAPTYKRFPKIIGYDAEGIFDCRIIPFPRFTEEGFSTDAAVLRFRDVPYRKLQKYCDRLAREFPELRFDMPENDFSQELPKIYIEYFLGYMMIPFVLSLISFLPIYALWIEHRKRFLYILRIAGISALSAYLLVIAEAALFIASGALASLLLQYALRPVLSAFDGGILPPFHLIILFMTIVFALCMLLNARSIHESIHIQKEGEW